MRQAVLVEPKHIEFREVEAPKASDLKEHQVLLNIKRIGIVEVRYILITDVIRQLFIR